MRVRPTLRCLRDDLALPPGPADEPLDEIDHVLLTKANKQFVQDGPRERIVAIDDRILFKVKVERWRGAVWEETPEGDRPRWLVAAGRREEGSRQDFYRVLAEGTVAARARFNRRNSRRLASRTYTSHLLPGDEDRARYTLEAAARFERSLAEAINDLCRRSLLDGQEHRTEMGSVLLGIQVLAADGNETYVAVRIVGSVPDNVTGVILSLVPGCDDGGWGPEYGLPERPLQPAEQAWSNIMDPHAAAKLLDEE